MTGSVGMMGSCQLFIDVCKERHFSTHYKEQQTLEGTFTIDMGGGDKYNVIWYKYNKMSAYSQTTLYSTLSWTLKGAWKMDTGGSMQDGQCYLIQVL